MSMMLILHRPWYRASGCSRSAPDLCLGGVRFNSHRKSGNPDGFLPGSSQFLMSPRLGHSRFLSNHL